MAPAQTAAAGTEQPADDEPETQPLLQQTAQLQETESIVHDNASTDQQLKQQPHSPTKTAATQPQLSKQGSSAVRVKSQELGQCR